MIGIIIMSALVSGVVSALAVRVMAKRCIDVLDKHSDGVLKMTGEALSEVIAMVNRRK